MLDERRHDAPHRAEQPDERRDARGRRQKRHPIFEFVDLDGRGPQQRAVDGREALESRTAAGAAGLDAAARVVVRASCEVSSA